MTDRTDPLGVAFLGCGWAARIHARALRRAPGIDIAFASRDVRRAESLCARFDGRRAYASYTVALEDPAVDVAVVCTPTSSHRELALQALAAGKHVVVEKPAFLRADDADVVRAAAVAAGRRVLVAENYVYKPVAAHLRRLVGAGALGEVRFVTLNATKRQPTVGWRGDPALSGGGALFEAGVHWVSFASNLGLKVQELFAWRVGAQDGPDRSSLLVFRYAGGAVGTLAHSWELRAPLGGLRLSKVQGTRGAVTFESNGMAMVTTGRSPSLHLPALGDPLGYRAMWADFSRALRTGGPSIFTLDMAQRDLALLEDAERQMSDSGAEVPSHASAA